VEREKAKDERRSEDASQHEKEQQDIELKGERGSKLSSTPTS
jgi:hypothetical protein